ncbi:MAG TPA: ROK family protein [Streptosporangiaceae bacterium]|jgi:predicted NBD/HSP70 family sugar kinase|nr:ROK family protein [Streptosporangiaceae bacterium]
MTDLDAQAAPGMQPARPQLIRTMNEQLLLNQIRQLGLCSRADLARLSGLSKPTVSLALANVQRSGLVRTAGQRTGVPGRSAVLYEIRPEAGYVLGLDIGHEYLRGAVTDLTGEIRAKAESRCTAASVRKRVSELIKLADGICSAAGIARDQVTQTVLGTPGVYDPRLDAITLTGGMAGWDRPAVLADLRRAFGANVAVENDTDAAALAEREHGHGREFASFVFVSIGTGIGMGLVLGGQLHRGAHGVAGEIAFLPITEGPSKDVADDEVRRRGTLEAGGSAAAIVRAGRKAGLTAQSARQVFAAATAGEQRAAAIVSAEARLVAKAICAIIAVVDPGLVVLGGGIGQAPGFAATVGTELAQIAPVLPELRVSALGTSAVVDGCLASGADLAWRRLTAQLAQLSPELAHADQSDQAPVSDQPPALDDEAELTQPAGVR